MNQIRRKVKAIVKNKPLTILRRTPQCSLDTNQEVTIIGLD